MEEGPSQELLDSQPLAWDQYQQPLEDVQVLAAEDQKAEADTSPWAVSTGDNGETYDTNASASTASWFAANLHQGGQDGEWRADRVLCEDPAYPNDVDYEAEGEQEATEAGATVNDAAGGVTGEQLALDSSKELPPEGSARWEETGQRDINNPETMAQSTEASPHCPIEQQGPGEVLTTPRASGGNEIDQQEVWETTNMLVWTTEQTAMDVAEEPSFEEVGSETPQMMRYNTDDSIVEQQEPHSSEAEASPCAPVTVKGGQQEVIETLETVDCITSHQELDASGETTSPRIASYEVTSQQDVYEPPVEEPEHTAEVHYEEQPLEATEDSCSSRVGNSDETDVEKPAGILEKQGGSVASRDINEQQDLLNGGKDGEEYGGDCAPGSTADTIGEEDQWLELCDPALGAVYYYALRSGEVRWEPPPETSSIVQSSEGDAIQSTIISLQSVARSRQARARVSLLKQNRQDHSQQVDEDADLALENQDQFLLKDDAVDTNTVAPLLSDLHGLDDESVWVEVYDPVQQMQYYYCSRTGATRWEAPDSFVSSAENREVAAAIAIQSLSRGRIVRNQLHAVQESQEYYEVDLQTDTEEQGDAENEAICRREMVEQELLQLNAGDRFWGLDIHARELEQQRLEEELTASEQLYRRSSPTHSPRDEVAVNYQQQHPYLEFTEETVEEEEDAAGQQQELREEAEARMTMAHEEEQQCQHDDNFWGIQAEEYRQDAARIAMSCEEAASHKFGNNARDQALYATWTAEADRNAAEEVAARGGKEQLIQARYLRWFYQQCTSISPTREILCGAHRKLNQLPSLAKPKPKLTKEGQRLRQAAKAKARAKAKATTTYPDANANQQQIPSNWDASLSCQDQDVNARREDNEVGGVVENIQEDPNAQLPREEREILAQVFAHMDLDESGTVNQREMRWALQRDKEIHALATTSPLLRLLLKQRSGLEDLFALSSDNASMDATTDPANESDSSNELSWEDFLARCEHMYLRLMTDGLLQAAIVSTSVSEERGPRKPQIKACEHPTTQPHDEVAKQKEQCEEEHTIRRVFALLDTDGNGVLEVSEILQALYSTASSVSNAIPLANTPDIADELRALVVGSKALQPMLQQDLFMTAFNKFEPLDPRGISEEEFVAFCLEIEQVAAANNMAPIVE
ncbi:hypothetical protein BBJ28_00016324 [Nothophytophthora sp. Chile5]|nr:hypothetical protein BBJ28_00016324 [Nothophytophthora sp. Chile5]